MFMIDWCGGWPQPVDGRSSPAAGKRSKSPRARRGPPRCTACLTHEQGDQLTAHRFHFEQCRQFGQVDESVRIPGSPIVVGSIDDTENTVVGVSAASVQQTADLLH